MRLPAHDPLARSIVSMIHGGRTEALQLALDANPGLATAAIMDAKGQGRSLLHIATDWPGHFPEIARTIGILIAAGADVNARFLRSEADAAPETPLHWAASCDDVAALDALLDGGADIEAPGAVFTGGAPMSDAVIFAQWNAARRLLERGARTTLTQAAALGLVERVQQHLAGGTKDRGEITAALWHGCRGGWLPAARLLIDHGANINWIGWDRRTPLDVAEESGNQELIGWLQANGAKRAAEAGANRLH